MYRSTHFEQLPEPWLKHDREAGKYRLLHLLLVSVRFIFGVSIYAYFILKYKGLALQIFIESLIGFKPFQWIAYFTLVIVGWRLISSPFSAIGYLQNKKAGISKQGLRVWVMDRLKWYGVTTTLLLSAIMVIYVAMRQHWEGWWLITAVVFGLFGVFLTFVGPIIFSKLFFRGTPIEEGEIKRKILLIAKDFRVGVNRIIVVPTSEKTHHDSVSIVGLGGAKDVYIDKGLKDHCTQEEVIALFGQALVRHMGFYPLRIAALAVIFNGIVLWISASIYNEFAPALNIALNDPFALMVFWSMYVATWFPFSIGIRAYSRSLEKKADLIAAREMGVSTTLANALEKLTLKNRELFSPMIALEYLLYTRPAPWRRILYLREEHAEL